MNSVQYVDGSLLTFSKNNFSRAMSVWESHFCWCFVLFFHFQTSEFHRLANAKIFLSDCLACDNCITSDEAVRIFQQNQKELFRVLSLNKVKGRYLLF